MLVAGTLEMSLAKDLRTSKHLNDAWRHVRQRGLTSPSTQSREMVREFDADSFRRIRSISQRLQRKTFRFGRSFGVLGRTGSGKPRPIVVSSIDDRIVRRAILSLLQKQPGLKPIFDQPTSFGCVAGRGVREAMEFLLARIRAGMCFYVRSDIRSFFPSIPRHEATDRLVASLDDEEFIALVRSAISVELENFESLGPGVAYFPIHDTGVAQGSALSPLLGNVILSDFDREMNSGSETACVRYVDDFVVVGRDMEKVQAQYSRGLEILRDLGMSAYTPGAAGATKAKQGSVDSGLSFLGCDVTPLAIRPSAEKHRELVRDVRRRLDDSLRAMRSGHPEDLAKHSYVSTLKSVDLMLKGWGDQYAFCNASDLMGALDKQVDGILENYYREYSRILAGVRKSASRRSLIGVQALSRCKSDPVVINS